LSTELLPVLAIIAIRHNPDNPDKINYWCLCVAGFINDMLRTPQAVIFKSQQNAIIINRLLHQNHFLRLDIVPGNQSIKIYSR